MKLQDKETLSIAAAVSDVIEKKIVKEIKYPHKMYSPDGEEVTANNKEEHEKYSAKGYSHEKPVEESPEEPRAKGEKEFKAKHAVKKSGMNTDGSNVKEGKVVHLEPQDEVQTTEDELSPKQKKYQAFFQKALKKFGVKSPAELDGDKKKEFFDYVDKNYDAEGEKAEEVKKPKKEEVTITIDTTILEAKKPGKGKTTLDIDYIGDQKHAKTAEKRHKIKIKPTGRSTADITGEKKNIIAYLKDPDLYGMDDLDIEDIYPQLFK
jgi:hypothetical protein